MVDSWKLFFQVDDAGKETYFEKEQFAACVWRKVLWNGIEQHFIDLPLAKLNVLFSFMMSARGASSYKIIYTVVLVNLLLTRIAALKAPLPRFFDVFSSSLCQFYSVLSAEVMVFLGKSTFSPFSHSYFVSLTIFDALSVSLLYDSIRQWKWKSLFSFDENETEFESELLMKNWWHAKCKLRKAFGEAEIECLFSLLKYFLASQK